MDLQTFSERVLSVRGRLFRVARFFLRSREEAEDITQEVLLRLWDKRHDLDRYHSLEALAVRMTRNVCLDQLKSHDRTRMDREAVMTETPAQELTPYQEVEQADNTGLLYRLISELPEQQRIVLELRDVEAYSFEEIDAVLGLGVNNIRVILSRARKKMRENYLKHTTYGT